MIHTFAVGYNACDPEAKKFLSWQTWDLLRITWYGYREFCKSFLQRHPGYYVYPLRLTGSAIETVFSRLKYTTGGHLSAVNYASARANLLTRYDVHGRHNRPIQERSSAHQRTRVD